MWDSVKNVAKGGEARCEIADLPTDRQMWRRRRRLSHHFTGLVKTAPPPRREADEAALALSLWPEPGRARVYEAKPRIFSMR